MIVIVANRIVRTADGPTEVAPGEAIVVEDAGINLSQRPVFTLEKTLAPWLRSH